MELKQHNGTQAACGIWHVLWGFCLHLWEWFCMFAITMVVRCETFAFREGFAPALPRWAFLICCYGQINRMEINPLGFKCPLVVSCHKDEVWQTC